MIPLLILAIQQVLVTFSRRSSHCTVAFVFRDWESEGVCKERQSCRWRYKADWWRCEET